MLSKLSKQTKMDLFEFGFSVVVILAILAVVHFHG